MNKKIAIIGLFLLVSIGFAGLQYYSIFYNLDRVTRDYLYQKEETVDPQIKIIKIDEKTLERYGAFGSWSRQIYADLVNKLYKEAQPYLIGFDIIFTGEIDKDGDQAFVEACKKSDNVVVANNIVLTEKLLKEDNVIYGINKMHVDRIEQPYQTLKEVTKQGFSNAILDKDGMNRKSLLNIPYNNYYYDSFATIIAKSYSQKRNQSFEYPLTDSNRVFGFKYTGKSHSYEEVSLVDILDNKIDLKAFKDCVVLIGAHAPGMQDAYSVPIEYGRQMYGVEIHANIIESLMNQSTVLETNNLWVSIAVFIFSFLSCLIVYKFSLIKSTLFLGISILIYVFVCIRAIDYGFDTPLIVFPIVAICIYGFNIVRNYLIELKQKRKTLETFKKYVAPQIVEQLMNQKNLHFDLSGEQRDIAVLFVDIRGFTSLSEQVEPKDLVDILNHYFNLTTSIIFENLGTLDKFIGDATMAVFNSPFDLDDYVYHAVKTAYMISQNSDTVCSYVKEKFNVEIGVGIGVHCGNAVVGNIGSNKRLDFTAIGDTVNTASRLESHAKAKQVLISEEVVKRLGNRIKTKEIGTISLKGKSQLFVVYEVIGLKEDVKYEEKI